MAKKAHSGPMTEMLNRLTSYTDGLGQREFQTVFFDEEAILHAPIEEWPRCEVLIAFFSTGFPLQKAQSYAALRKPVVLNDLHKQEILFDRRATYRMLEESGVPVPTYAVFNAEDAATTSVREEEDYLELNGVSLPSALLTSDRCTWHHLLTPPSLGDPRGRCASRSPSSRSPSRARTTTSTSTTRDPTAEGASASSARRLTGALSTSVTPVMSVAWYVACPPHPTAPWRPVWQVLPGRARDARA